jgi:hypothetical protein
VLLVVYPLLTTAVIFIDMPLWGKVTYPIVGFLAGIGLRFLIEYIDRKLKRRKSS